MHTLFRNAQTRGPWQPLWRPFLLLLLLTLALCGTARAQRGGYQILQATYGTQWQSVDVTGRVQQLAQQGERFQAGNEAFGVDPAPGQRKTLRIQARGRDGRERTTEYGESQWVDGSRLSAGGGYGDPGGAYGGGQVVQATYGTAWQSIDVTERIRQLARLGGGFQVGNDLFGTDPAPGQRNWPRGAAGTGTRAATGASSSTAPPMAMATGRSTSPSACVPTCRAAGWT